MQGIVCDTNPSVKDEAPQAYKDLSVVMENQKSLTDIVYQLLPLVNVKGYESKIPKRYRSKEQGRESLETSKKQYIQGLQNINAKLQNGGMGISKTNAAQAKKKKMEEALVKIEAKLGSMSDKSESD